jgi:hypothetical protein
MWVMLVGAKLVIWASHLSVMMWVITKRGGPHN